MPPGTYRIARGWLATAGFWCALMGVVLAGRQAARLKIARDIPVPHVTADSPVLRFPPAIRSGDCQISTFITGSFGGYGSFAMAVNDRDQAIAATVGSARARSLKAIVYCRESALVLIDVPALGPDRVVLPVRLSPLGSVPLRGAVMLPPNTEPVSVAVRATYRLDWGHAFFGITDGMVPQVGLGQQRLDPGGTFEFAVPDFANDPSIAQFQSRGSISLQAVDPTTQNHLFTLVTESSRDLRMGHIPIGRSYPYLRLRVGAPGGD